MDIYLPIGICFAVSLVGIIALWLRFPFRAFGQGEAPFTFDREAVLERLLEAQHESDTDSESLDDKAA